MIPLDKHFLLRPPLFRSRAAAHCFPHGRTRRDFATLAVGLSVCLPHRRTAGRQVRRGARCLLHFAQEAAGTAKAQAEDFIKNVKLENGDLPPVLDVEHKPKNQTDEQFKASVLEWLEMVEKHYHIKPIIYTYYKFKLKYLNDSVFDSYPYWIAHYYVEQVEYEGPWKFWQHTDNGRLAGIKGTVDFNIYNGSFYDLRKLTIGAREQIGEEAYQDE